MSTGWWGLIGGGVAGAVISPLLLLYFWFAPWAEKERREAVEADRTRADQHTIYWLRVEVDITAQPDHPSPDMRFRWMIWQEGIAHTVPLQLGNAPSWDMAHRMAYAWINNTQRLYVNRTLPVAIPL